jgi:adenylate cyclase
VRLLLVDDEMDVKRLFELRFRREIRDGDLEIQFAANGRLALEAINADPNFDVVVTDLNMPEMDGLTLLGEISELSLPLKTIVLTAYDDMANIRVAMMRGAFDFQVKPLDIEDLRHTLAKAVAIVRELRTGARARRLAAELEGTNRHLEDIFSRYVSDDVVAHLLGAEETPELGGERRELTVMMADIRGFTRLSEEFSPEAAVSALNDYLELATQAILRRLGTINEILGDGLLVFFGAPIPDEQAAEHALAAAIELQLAMGKLNESHRARGLPELAVGIGIHTGEAIVGSIGSKRRMKYTAVGRTVNLAARIEGATIGGQILISAETARAVGPIAETVPGPELRLKGVSEPIQVLDVTGLGGKYALHLPRETVDPVELPRSVPVQLAQMVGKALGETRDAELVAVAPDSARLRTELVVSPLDDLVCLLEGEQIYGKVGECDVADGVYMLTLIFTSASRRAKDLLQQTLASGEIHAAEAAADGR